MAGFRLPGLVERVERVQQALEKGQTRLKANSQEKNT